jgi:hypothetical protein
LDLDDLALPPLLLVLGLLLLPLVEEVRLRSDMAEYGDRSLDAMVCSSWIWQSLPITSLQHTRTHTGQSNEMITVTQRYT